MVKVVQLLLLASGVFLACVAMPSTTQLDDASARSERSANLSHITGSARKIRMYIKNRYLQILPDGTVNGTGDDLSDYTILQRTSVHIGQVKIQGVATCMYLCLDSCGLLYASKDYTDDCVFNEMIEHHNYNTYSSAKYSNSRSTMYFALNKKGVSRRVRVKARTPLGKLSTYTRVLTTFVPPNIVEALARKLIANSPGNHALRHHHLCPPTPPHKVVETTDVERCRKRRKRRKKRRCREGEEESDECHKVKTPDERVPPLAKKRVPPRGRKCEEGEGKGKCQKKLHIGRKRKSRHENKRLLRHLQPNIRSRVDLSNQRSDEEDEDDIDDGDAVTMTTLVDEDYTTDLLLLDTNDK